MHFIAQLFAVAACLSFTCALPEAMRPTSCPVLHSGTTTKEVPGPGLTSTSYTAVAAIYYDINCHGYSNLFRQTTGPSPTTTIKATGTLETRITVCAYTPIPTGCPTDACPSSHRGTTTLVLPGPGATSTHYAHTSVEDISKDCHGYQHITTSTSGPKPTKTVSRKGSVTSPEYACKPTSKPAGC